MTPAAAKAFLDKLVDEHLSFNGNVEWRSGATEALVALANKTAVIETALEDAGLIAVWLGKDKVQIVCRPGRFEHARAALGLEEAPK